MTANAVPIARAEDSHREEIVRWRAERVAALTAPDGWLTLVGLEWLQPGPNRVGSAAGNDIVLPVGPAHLGVITLAADGCARLHLAADGDARVEGEIGTDAAMRDDTSGSGLSTIVRFGTASLSLIARDGRMGLRIKDNNASARAEFLGLDYYPIEPTWRIAAEWVASGGAETLPIATTIGTVREQPVRGKAVFTRDGRRYALSAVGGRADALSFVVADATSGRETYGGARFLTPDIAADGGMVLDFNKATNPLCAFTPYATCPLAPPENRLDVAITAGEKVYRGADH